MYGAAIATCGAAGLQKPLRASASRDRHASFSGVSAANNSLQVYRS